VHVVRRLTGDDLSCHVTYLLFLSNICLLLDSHLQSSPPWWGGEVGGRGGRARSPAPARDPSLRRLIYAVDRVMCTQSRKSPHLILFNIYVLPMTTVCMWCW